MSPIGSNGSPLGFPPLEYAVHVGPTALIVLYSQPKRVRQPLRGICLFGVAQPIRDGRRQYPDHLLIEAENIRPIDPNYLYHPKVLTHHLGWGDLSPTQLT